MHHFGDNMMSLGTESSLRSFRGDTGIFACINPFLVAIGKESISAVILGSVWNVGFLEEKKVTILIQEKFHARGIVSDHAFGKLRKQASKNPTSTSQM